MNRRVLFARLHLGLLLLAYAVWMAASGLDHMIDLRTQRLYAHSDIAIFLSVLATLVGLLFLAERLPDLAADAHLFPVHVLAAFSLVGSFALVLGCRLAWDSLFQQVLFGGIPHELLSARLVAGIVLIVGIFLRRSPRTSAEPLFLLDRTHAANADARRCLWAGMGQASIVTLAIALALEYPPTPAEPAPLPRLLFLFGASYVGGVFLSALLRYPQRIVGLVPLAAVLAAVAMLAVWIAPSAEWPVLLLGGAAGLAHAGPRLWLIVMLPPGQRVKGLAVMAIAQGLGVLLALGLIHGALAAGMSAGAFRGLRFAVITIMAALAVRSFFRELFEQTVAMVIWICYPIRGHGPGMRSVPTRGPILVIANHCAWLDPLWVAKVIPVQLRPLMTARFFDLPVIRWLMRRVFFAIRVPDSRFRREAPEIQDAIAALHHGQNVLLFPEGWLKRKEEQSLRRFGQGIYQILREAPQTPVVACWIEGGWGSYFSFFKGPPTKNKKLDLLRRIRIGVSDPQLLTLELLHDQHQTRRHLMLAVLNARTYLGLPVLPAPPFAAAEDEDKEEE